MTKSFTDILVPAVGIVAGVIASVIKSPILGIGLLIATLIGWEGIKRYLFRQSHAKQM